MQPEEGGPLKCESSQNSHILRGHFKSLSNFPIVKRGDIYSLIFVSSFPAIPVDRAYSENLALLFFGKSATCSL